MIIFKHFTSPTFVAIPSTSIALSSMTISSAFTTNSCGDAVLLGQKLTEDLFEEQRRLQFSAQNSYSISISNASAGM